MICIFDTDVAERVDSEKKQLIKLQNKYKNNVNVIFCDSLPSIEYWFLLHHEKTNRYFNSSAEVEKLLKKHIKDYKKAQDFLENEKWVKDLCADGKLESAIQRAKDFGQEGDYSYSNVHLAFEMLTNRNLKD